MESAKFGLCGYWGYRNRNASRVGPVEDLLIFFCKFLFFQKESYYYYYFFKCFKIKAANANF